MNNETQMECHTWDLCVYHLFLWAEEWARSHCAFKFQWRIPDNPVYRTDTAHLFFRESCCPDRYCREGQNQNGALPEKIPESWLRELGDWKWAFFGMVLCTLKKQVMFISSPLFWLLLSSPFQAPFPSNFLLGSHWNCFPSCSTPKPGRVGGKQSLL